MKILHTADWHIGSRLNGASRKQEQQSVLDEIINIANAKEVDIVLVCGDVFHDVTLTGYADKMFIDTLIKLSDNGNRAVVVIAGNHDDEERLTASKNFAERENIFLVHSLNYDYGLNYTLDKKINLIETGKGYLKFRKGAEILVLNLMPYAGKWFRNEGDVGRELLIQKLIRLYSLGAAMFDNNSINVSLGHFFVPNKDQQEDIYTEIDRKFLPKAHYTAMGHVHDPIEVDEELNIQYSGSPYQIYPTEKQTKSVVILDINNKGIQRKELIKIKSKQNIVTIQVSSYDDCYNKLLSKSDCLVSINTVQGRLTSEEIQFIRKTFKNIISFNIMPEIRKSVDIKTSKDNPYKVFTSFYESRTGKKPSESLLNTFNEVLKGEEDNENY